MLPANLVEEHLNRAEWSWRMSRFLQRSAVIGIATLGCLLVLGLFARVGLLNNLGLAVLLLILILLVSGMVWLVTALVTLTAPLDRTRLGMELEHVEPRLLDRVNALVHLEGKLEKSSPFLVHLASQSAEVLTTPGAGRPRIAPQVVRTLALLLVVTLITAAFYRLVQPFQHIRQAELAAAELRKQNDEDPDRLVIPDDTWLEETPAERDEEEEQPWTEIRIRDPGRDLRATRYDLIPLVIEAYSTEPLDEIILTIEVLGREPERIAFPASEDPHYTLQEYELDLLSLDVAEWDVIQYFAETRTQEPRKSELYFIDVLPTQEELEQLAKDADDESYRTLRELTHQIQQQQNVLRDHHRDPAGHELNSPAPPNASEPTEQLRLDEQQSPEQSPEQSPQQSPQQSPERLTNQWNELLCQLVEARREAACQIQPGQSDSPEGAAHTKGEGQPSSDGNELEKGDSPDESEDSGGGEAPSDKGQEGEEEGAGEESSGGGPGSDEGEEGKEREPGERGEGTSGSAGGSSDELRESGQEAWRRAARQLESLERRQASGQPLDQQQERLLRDDTAARLSRAVDSWLGANPSADPPLARLREELEQPRDAMDWSLIRELMEQVQRQRRESMPRSDSEGTTAELKNIESSRFSPAYRDALERYFQSLSELP